MRIIYFEYLKPWISFNFFFFLKIFPTTNGVSIRLHTWWSTMWSKYSYHFNWWSKLARMICVDVKNGWNACVRSIKNPQFLNTFEWLKNSSISSSDFPWERVRLNQMPLIVENSICNLFIEKNHTLIYFITWHYLSIIFFNVYLHIKNKI